MSLTIQQIITDAKRLASRLKERDSTADILLNETHAINKKIDAMKQVIFTALFHYKHTMYSFKFFSTKKR